MGRPNRLTGIADSTPDSYRDGQRMIYASYSSATQAASDSLYGSHANIWCDGGSPFFAVEYNALTGSFDQLERHDKGEFIPLLEPGALVPPNQRMQLTRARWLLAAAAP